MSDKELRDSYNKLINKISTASKFQDGVASLYTLCSLISSEKNKGKDSQW